VPLFEDTTGDLVVVEGLEMFAVFARYSLGHGVAFAFDQKLGP